MQLRSPRLTASPGTSPLPICSQKSNVGLRHAWAWMCTAAGWRLAARWREVAILGPWPGRSLVITLPRSAGEALSDHVVLVGILIGASAARAVPHLLPEARQISPRYRLPTGWVRTSPALAHERLLPAAEGLAQLGPVRLVPARRIRAQLEGATVLAVTAGRRLHSPDRPPRVKRVPVLAEARRQVIAIDPPEALLHHSRLLSALREIQHEQHISDELLSTRVKRRPAGRWRDPQIVLPVGTLARRPGPYFRDSAALVDPQEALRAAGLQCPDGQLARFGNERVVPVAGEPEPAPYDRLGIRSTPVSPVLCPAPAVKPGTGVAGSLRAWFWHLPQAKR